MFGLFERYDEAGRATVLSAKIHNFRMQNESGGVRYDFVLDVTPAQSEPFRVMITQRMPRMISAPQAGDVVNVKYNAKTKKAKLALEGDLRYDRNMLVQAQRRDEQNRQEGIRMTPPGAQPPAPSNEAQDAVQEMMRRRAKNEPPPQ
jgi:hypothetical protein